MALDGVEIFLIVMAVVVALLITAIAIVTLIKFQHPDDKNQAWFPKITVVCGIILVFAAAMVMPFDVAARDYISIDVHLLWMIILIAVAAFALLIVPFAFFYYESDIDDVRANGKVRGCCDRQLASAICYTFIFAVIVIALTVVLYATPANTAEIPTHRIIQDVTNFVPICTSPLGTAGNTIAPFRNTASSGETCLQQGGGCSSLGTTFNWNISVSFVVYFFALLAFLGWWFFFLFAGVGLVALPMELINDFRTRPKPMTTTAYAMQCSELADRCDAQIESALLLRDGPKGAKARETEEDGWGKRFRHRKFSRQIVAAEQEYYFLQRDFDLLKISKEFSKSNPLWYVLKLVLGIIGLVLSIAWVLQIALFILPGVNNEVDPFLNTLFIRLSNLASGDFPLFGVLAYAIFVFYLMWCTMTGAFKVGIRILIIRMFPMEVGKTMMNSFLANVWVLLLCTFPLIQFIATAFPVYARYTAVEALFGNQIRYLRGFNVFWRYNIFVIMMLAIAFITIIVMICCPNDRRKDLKKKLDERAAARPRRLGTTADK